MSDEHTLPERVTTRADGDSIAPAPRSRLSRVSTNPKLSAARAAQARPKSVVWLLVVLLTVGLAAMWSLIAQRELDMSAVAERATALDRARATFDSTRARSQEALRALTRLLVEDPRLKSTLATENMDAATVDDILNDLGKLRGAGFFVVLSPEGRVFAEAGAKELRGLDLSGSGIVKRAQSEPGAAVGSWALGDKVMDLSIMAIRYGDVLIAYLAVGKSIDDTDMKSLALQCGCEASTAIGNSLATSSTTDPAVSGLFTQMIGVPHDSRGQILNAGAARFVTTTIELGDVAQSHRLMLASRLDRPAPPFIRLWWLLWVPPALVLVAVLFALSTRRSSRRPS